MEAFVDYEITFLVLATNGIRDVRKKEVSLLELVAYAFAGVMLHIFRQQLEVYWLFSFLPGMISLIFSKFSGEKIGYGDSFFLLAMGCFYPVDRLLILLFIALGLAGVVGLGLIIFFQKNRSYQIPFVPFLMAGFLLEAWGYCR